MAAVEAFELDMEALQNRFPGKKIRIRTREMKHDEVWNLYTNTRAYAFGASKFSLQPNMVVINGWDGTVFIKTNVFGMLGEAVDRSCRLAAIWGDSVVAGHGLGWIRTEPNVIPGFQVLNGGIGACIPDEYIGFAIERNKRLPIEFNVIFPGWNICFRGDNSMNHFKALLHATIAAVPGVVLCTAATSMNSDMIDTPPEEYEATSKEMGYRGGYHTPRFGVTPHEVAYWAHGLSVAYAEAVYEVAEEARSAGREVPVIDFYRRFNTRGKADFRVDFIDYCHFRVERYPEVWGFFSEEFEKIVAASEERRAA